MKILHFIANAKRDFALNKNEEEYKKLYTGATYVPLDSTMILQKENANLSIKAILDNRGDGSPETIVWFQKSWSSTIYPCQKMNSHGIMFPRVPPLKITGRDASEFNLSVPWILSALLTQIEPLWRIGAEHHDLRTSMWHGWMLRFLTKRCFPGGKNQARKDPFKNQFIP